MIWRSRIAASPDGLVRSAEIFGYDRRGSTEWVGLFNNTEREANFKSLNEKVEISEKELKMSSSLVKSFESDFSPADFTDEYQVQLQKLVDAKLEQGESVDTDATFGKTDDEEGDGEVIDLMEALKRSVEANRAKSKPSSGSSRKRA